MPQPPDEEYRCPECGFEGLTGEFDSLGACLDDVFCPRCSCEFDPVTHEIHEADPSTCDGCRALLEDGAEIGGFHHPNPSSLYLPKGEG